VHEIKHDGYRLIVRRDGDAVRLFTRRGYDWTERYPAITAAAGKLRAKSFTLDGEAVVTGADGVAVFDALHRLGSAGWDAGLDEAVGADAVGKHAAEDKGSRRAGGVWVQAQIQGPSAGAGDTGRSMDFAEQIDDPQQDGPSDKDQQRRVHDHADRFTSFRQVSSFQ
jgi:hypothetical protein